MRKSKDATGSRIAALAVTCLAAALAACAGPLYLMPTPEAFRTGDIDVFELTPEQERSLQVPVLYATNRLPATDMDRLGYGKKFDDKLRLGLAYIQIGEDDSGSWEELYAKSTIEERDSDILLKLDGVREFIVVDRDVDVEAPPAELLRLLGEVDRALQESLDRDLLIFVHGAKNSFYRSVGQAAQYRHFTGRHSVVLAFVWPSMENIVRYRTDARQALDSAPLLSTLVELLAAHTRARYINVLGYSLGASVVSESMYLLRQRNAQDEVQALRQRLRIGEVYYAAADVDLDRFVAQLKDYRDMVGRVSVTVNPNDSALGFAAWTHRKSRAGRPDAGQLDEQDLDWLREASHGDRFDLIEVASAIAPYAAFKAHDYWYNNPRVSMDVLIQMLSHATPDKRGLQRMETDRGFEVWGFPENYQERALAAVQALLEESGRQAGDLQ